MVIRYDRIELDRENRTVTHRGQTHRFNKGNNVQFKLFCHLLLGAGLSLEMLFQMIYGDDPDGGPMEGPHYFLIALNHMEKRWMNRLELEWRVWRIAGVNFYAIVPKHRLLDPTHRSVYKNLRRRARMAEIATHD